VEAATPSAGVDDEIGGQLLAGISHDARDVRDARERCRTGSHTPDSGAPPHGEAGRALGDRGHRRLGDRPACRQRHQVGVVVPVLGGDVGEGLVPERHRAERVGDRG
jgi:hypothetical protein